MIEASSAAVELDIVIPVYQEGENILAVLDHLSQHVKTRYRVLICYDFSEDDTLSALERCPEPSRSRNELVRNPGRGPHSAVLAGFRASRAGAVLMYPADDDYNGPILDDLFRLIQSGCDVACASRFLPGGCMVGCPWLKSMLVRWAAWSLHHVAGIPTHDATNGFRMFSRRCLDEIEIESTAGFTYSIELLVKAHRRGWRIGEVPAQWFERKAGKSKFAVLKWLPAYLRWYCYALATTFLCRREKPAGQIGR